MADRDCERFAETGALAAIGAAAPEEEQTLQAHLEGGCAACAEALRDFRETAARLAEALPAIVPPPAVRARLLDAIARESAVAPGRPAARPLAAFRRAPRSAWPRAGWALAAAMALVLIGSLYVQQKTRAGYETERLALQQALGEKERALQLIEARSTHTVWLKGSAQETKTVGKIFWNPEANSGFLVGFDLPAPPPGKVYQLWALQDKTPIDAGTFSPNTQGVAAMKVKPIPDPKRPLQAFAITAEPTGGSPQPTSSILFTGVPIF